MLAGDLPRACQEAEHVGPGVACGLMDKLAVFTGEEHMATLIDCKTESSITVQFPESQWRIIAIDSGQEHGLARSRYNKRLAEVEKALRTIQAAGYDLQDMRDVSLQVLATVALPTALDQRSRHVITENARVMRAVEALHTQSENALQQTTSDSHASLRDDFQISTPELNLLVSATEPSSPTIGSRLTGADFGGCTVNLVRWEHTEFFMEAVATQFIATFGQSPAIYKLMPAAPVAHGLLDNNQ